MWQRLFAQLRASPAVLITTVFALCVALALGLLAWAVLANRAEQDWARVASVNGVGVDRAHLRDRVALERFLLEQQSRMIADARSAGRLSEAEAASQRAALERAVGDPVVTARSDLVDEELVRQLAAREHVGAAAPDPWTELASFLGSGFSRHLRWIKISPPSAATGSTPASPAPTAPPTTPLPAYPKSSLADVAARASANLAKGATTDAILAALRTAWTAEGADRWIGPEGTVEGLDATLVAAARQLAAGAMIGPLADRHGALLVGRLVEIAPEPVSPSRLAADAANAHVSGDAVADWATAHALRVALSATITARLLASPVEQVRGQELVVGPSNPDGGTAGPWVELASLRLSDLGITVPPASGASAGPGSPPGAAPVPDRLAALLADLRSRSRDDRVAAFRALADQANGNGAVGSNRSGELGFVGKGDLAKAVSAAVFGPGITSGDIVGPIEVAGQPMLLLVEARYAGSLDHRSTGALVEARAPEADLAALETRFSPADVALIGDSGWYARTEFEADDPTAGALFGTAIGQLSDPLALPDGLAVVRPLEHRMAAADGHVRDRLAVSGFDIWYGAEQSKAKITLYPDPLPEAYPSASPTPSVSLGPQLTLPPAETPYIPVVPGLPSASPQPSAPAAAAPGAMPSPS